MFVEKMIYQIQYGNNNIITNYFIVLLICKIDVYYIAKNIQASSLKWRDRNFILPY